MKDITELADYIKSISDDSERFVVAISGFGGAGKSTTSRQLDHLLGSATLIHTDDFIAADANGALEGHHLNWDELEERVIKVAKTAKTLTARLYDRKTNRPLYEAVPAGKFIIIEGSIWLIQDKFKQFFDLSVWVDVPQDVANARGKKRDHEEYGANYDDLWDNVWGPREKDSFNKLRPDKNANILLKNNF